MTLSFGLWGEGSTAGDRKAAPVDTWPATVESVAVADALFDNPDLFGRLLSRDEALNDPSLVGLWNVADAVVADDERVAHAIRWLMR